MARILVVDDEANIREVIQYSLVKDGHTVEIAENGDAAWARLQTTGIDLLVLDVVMPGLDGLSLCRRLRATESGGPPIVFLSSRGEELDRVLGLELGGDDYLTKPFSPAELVARVKAVLRRVDGGGAPEVVQAGAVTIDCGRREVLIHDVPVEFTTKEFDLLRFLAERPGLALSRQQILDGVWGYDWFGDARTVDVHIAQVRKKLGDAVVIKTVRGVGYRLESPRPARTP
jgi:DNA-binding response OmpR family regulator